MSLLIIDYFLLAQDHGKKTMATKTMALLCATTPILACVEAQKLYLKKELFLAPRLKKYITRPDRRKIFGAQIEELFCAPKLKNYFARPDCRDPRAQKEN